MKRIRLLCTFAILLLCLTGCKSDKAADEADTDISSPDDMSDEDDKDTDDKSVVDTLNEVDLVELSKEIALSIAEGDFDQIYGIFNAEMKGQLTKKDLINAWNATVSGIGSCIRLYEIEEQTAEDYQIVLVTLQYELSGVVIRLVYDENSEIAGLFFTYADIDTNIDTDAAVNDDFEEIEITIGEEYPIDGILTLPANQINPAPAVILVPGSGSHDPDSTIGPNKPFRDIAIGLAKHGIASIRYQEHVLKYPELITDNFTIYDDSLDDAYKAISYAIGCDKINPGRIFIIGHSLGGMMAPKIAADNEEIAGIVCLAGSPRRLEDIILDQNRLVIEQSRDITEEVAAQALAEVEEMVNQVKNITDGDTGIYMDVPASYWYSLNQINIPDITLNLNIPVFIAQGSADWQVLKDKDYAAWQELLQDKDNVTFKLYDNLNHFFMTSGGNKDTTDYMRAGHVEEQVIDDIAEWINNIK